jgi:hypothetical protein
MQGPGVHTLLQPPQCSSSSSVSTHAPEHSVKPLGQAHTPLDRHTPPVGGEQLPLPGQHWGSHELAQPTGCADGH